MTHLGRQYKRIEPGALSLMPNALWCCAYTHPSEEPRAQASVQALGFETFLPALLIKTRTGERRELMFPRYLFIQADPRDTLWRRAQYAKGVVRLLGSEQGSPAMVRPGAVEALKAQCDEDGAATVDLRVDVKPGSTVKITDGPFVDFQGLCLKSFRDRVQVMLVLFGRPTSVGFRLPQVAVMA